MKREPRRICVFCGSSPGASPRYAAAAADLADRLSERGYGLVYGGGSVGLMGIVARRALHHGCEVIGVIPETLTDREIALTGVSQMHVVGSMHERKALMDRLSWGCIALPGGFGTLEEIFEVITWAQLGINRKPFGFLDVDGFFNDLFGFLDKATAEGFIREDYRNMVLRSESPHELLERFDTWEPPDPIAWLDLSDS